MKKFLNLVTITFLIGLNEAEVREQQKEDFLVLVEADETVTVNELKEKATEKAKENFLKEYANCEIVSIVPKATL